MAYPIRMQFTPKVNEFPWVLIIAVFNLSKIKKQNKTKKITCRDFDILFCINKLHSRTSDMDFEDEKIR